MPLTTQQAAAVASSAMTTRAAANGANDYRAIIFVFMNGGNDAHNTVIPTEATAYAKYAAGKQTRALANDVGTGAGQLRALTGSTLALHPNCTGLANLYNSGKAAILSNVGTLAVPMTKAQWNNQNPSVAYPFNLFSHNDQQDSWHSSGVQLPESTGWGGRVGDLLGSIYNPNQTLSHHISVAGNALFLSGNEYNQYQVGLDGATALAYETSVTAAVVPGSYTNLLERAVAQVYDSARRSVSVVNNAIPTAPAGFTDNSGNQSLGQQMRMIARMIAAARDHATLSTTTGFRQRRQIFYAQAVNFDTHADDLATHGTSIGIVSTAISEMHAWLTSVGLADKVTIITGSDFGRAQLTNGGGTDHGYGAHHFIVGDAVNAGIYGKATTLDTFTTGDAAFTTPEINGPQDAGQGRLLPTTSIHQYFATVAKWMGLTDTLSNGVNALDVTFPGLANFTGAAWPRDLGFMKP